MPRTFIQNARTHLLVNHPWHSNTSIPALFCSVTMSLTLLLNNRYTFPRDVQRSTPCEGCLEEWLLFFVKSASSSRQANSVVPRRLREKHTRSPETSVQVTVFCVGPVALFLGMQTAGLKKIKINFTLDNSHKFLNSLFYIVKLNTLDVSSKNFVVL